MATLTSLESSWDHPIDLTHDGTCSKVTASGIWQEAHAPVESWQEPARKKRRVESPNELSRLNGHLAVGYPLRWKLMIWEALKELMRMG